jgi:hypothetical protein
VVLHATSDALKVMIAEDAIFRDRLVMLNNAKRARRDATVQLLHGVAEVSPSVSQSVSQSVLFWAGLGCSELLCLLGL